MAAGAVALLALLPLGFVVAYTVITGPSESWHLLVRPRVGELLWNTVRLVAATMLTSAVIGLAGAWLVERTTLRWRPLWHALLVAPLAVPAFVNSYGWVSLTSSVQNYAGALLIITLSYAPLVYLPTVVMLRGLDPALEETAYALGHSRWRTFWTVVVPQLRPAVLGGCLLVGIHLLAEFGALQMLRFPTFTTAIYDQFKSSFNSAAANMIAGVLVIACLLLLTAELRLRGDRHYARVSHGTARPAVRQRLGAWTVPAYTALTALVALSLGVPIYSLVHWLVVGNSSASFDPGSLVDAAVTSLGLGAVGALATTLAALPVAWLAVRHRGRISMLLERSTYIANALPGIVVALALVTVSINVATPIYQTWVLLAIAYTIMFLPRAVVSVRSALEQAPVVLDDVAHSLGTSGPATLMRVTLPLIAPGIGAAAALVFLAVSTELTATLMLSPIGTSTLATQFWSASSGGYYGAAAPYALLMVVISLPATVLLVRQSAARTEGADRVAASVGTMTPETMAV